MKVVVTGGAGFIGANLCRILAGSGVRPIALDDLSTGLRSNLEPLGDAVEFVEGSILDRELCAEVLAGADAVVHLAARPSVARSVDDPMLTHRINVDGTMNLLELARAAERMPLFVFASSSSVYGANPELPKHEGLATRPRSPYAASKLTAEAYALAYQETYGLPVLAFRFFNVFGPLQQAGHAYAAVIPAFVDAALRGEALPIQGDGEQTRDFTYVDTVAGVITAAALGRIASPTPVNLAFGSRTSINVVADMIGELLRRELDRTYLPTRVGDVRDSQAANDSLRALFPNVEPVGLRAGLERTVEWMHTIVGT